MTDCLIGRGREGATEVELIEVGGLAPRWVRQASAWPPGTLFHPVHGAPAKLEPDVALELALARRALAELVTSLGIVARQDDRFVIRMLPPHRE